MKKIILILILILPVVVVSLVYMIAGFVVREAAVQPVTHIEINYSVMNANGVFTLGDDRALARNWVVGQVIDLRHFISVQPAPRAQFSALHITVELQHDDDKAITEDDIPEDDTETIPRPAAITVDQWGRITIHRAVAGLVIIRVDEFFSIEVHFVGGGT